MRMWKKSGLAAMALLLMGAGCISFSSDSSSSSSDGGVFQTKDGGVTWEQLSALPQESGVGSIAGVSVLTIEIDPSDPTAYYIGTSGNGMFYSYDAGNSWQRPEAQEVRSGTILDIEVDPRDVCTVYALMPDRILKSIDCTRTFSTIYVIDQSDEYLLEFALDWYNPDNLWAGDTIGTVLKTSDGGGTWTTMYRVDDEITDIMISNRDSRIVLVGTERDGVFRTEDSGASWTEYSKEDQKEFDDSDNVYGFTQVADGTSLIMYSEYGLLLSEDQGESWISIPLITESGEARIWSASYDPENASTIYYATSTTFYSSTTGGASWVTSDLPSSRAAAEMVAHPEDGDRVLMGFVAIDN